MSYVRSDTSVLQVSLYYFLSNRGPLQRSGSNTLAPVIYGCELTVNYKEKNDPLFVI